MSELDTERAAIAAGAEEVERQAAKIKSKQPRFGSDATGFFMSFFPWLLSADEQCPEYQPASMYRDQFLRAYWRKESHLAGVVNAVNLIDSNRGWELVGGRNQVNKYAGRLHASDGSQGWRHYARRSSLSFWCTDMGVVSEVWRDGRGGPMMMLMHVDSARCELTGKIDTPLKYCPASGAPQYWQEGDYFRACSLPSDDESYLGLGFCALSRVLDVGRILAAIMRHDEEKLGTRMPEGLLLLKGITQTQWAESLAQREEYLSDIERRKFDSVQVLAGMGDIDAKLIALSELPENFDRREFTDLMMYSIALCFGYDPNEFWPVQSGSLGRGKETEIQHVKATSKGVMDWALAMQEQIQLELPPSLAFEFEQRDEAGEMLAAEVAEAKLSVIKTMYEAAEGRTGASLITREEARSLAVAAHLIPDDWTQAEEDVSATDTESERRRDAERWMADARVQRARVRFPNEEIMRYRWPSGRMDTLYCPGHIRMFPGVRRADDEVLYASEGVVITEADVAAAIDQAARSLGPEIRDLLQAPVSDEIPEGVGIAPPTV